MNVSLDSIVARYFAAVSDELAMRDLPAIRSCATYPACHRYDILTCSVSLLWTAHEGWFTGHRPSRAPSGPVGNRRYLTGSRPSGADLLPTPAIAATFAAHVATGRLAGHRTPPEFPPGDYLFDAASALLDMMTI